MIHGDDIIVMTDVTGTISPVAASKSCNIDISQSFIDVCAPTESRVYSKKPTTYAWSVSCDNLMATNQNAKKFLDAIKAGTQLTLQFIVAGFKQVGNAYVKSWNVSGQKNGLVKFNVSFEGSGALTDVIGWDFINGTIYMNGEFSSGSISSGGTITSGTLAAPSAN